MPLPFNKSLDLKLIKLVRENDILYNTRHPKYLDFDSREVVWQKIGDNLSRPALVCKSRWVNIRDMMRRKIRDRLRNPGHRSYKYKYEEELSFMMSFFKEPTSTDYADYLEEEASCSVEIPAEVFSEEFERSEDCREEFDRSDREDCREVKPSVSFRQKKEENSCRESNDVYQELNPADPLDVFLITIGSTLRKFSPYYLNQAKSKIFQVVQDYELQQIVGKNDQVPGSSDSTR